MDPMLSRILAERQHHISVVDDLGDRLGILGSVVNFEDLDRDLRPIDVLGVLDLPHRHQRTRMRGLRQCSKHICLL
jgi:hypothetical protein